MRARRGRAGGRRSTRPARPCRNAAGTGSTPGRASGRRPPKQARHRITTCRSRTEARRLAAEYLALHAGEREERARILFAPGRDVAVSDDFADAVVRDDRFGDGDRDTYLRFRERLPMRTVRGDRHLVGRKVLRDVPEVHEAYADRPLIQASLLAPDAVARVPGGTIQRHGLQKRAVPVDEHVQRGTDLRVREPLRRLCGARCCAGVVEHEQVMRIESLSRVRRAHDRERLPVRAGDPVISHGEVEPSAARQTRHLRRAAESLDRRGFRQRLRFGRGDPDSIARPAIDHLQAPQRRLELGGPPLFAVDGLPERHARVGVRHRGELRKQHDGIGRRRGPLHQQEQERDDGEHERRDRDHGHDKARAGRRRQDAGRRGCAGRGRRRTLSELVR